MFRIEEKKKRGFRNSLSKVDFVLFVLHSSSRREREGEKKRKEEGINKREERSERERERRGC